MPRPTIVGWTVKVPTLMHDDDTLRQRTEQAARDGFQQRYGYPPTSEPAWLHVPADTYDVDGQQYPVDAYWTCSVEAVRLGEADA